MAWANSRVFRAFLADICENLAPFDIGSGGDSLKAALYNNTPTPDNDVSAANSAFDVDQWDNVNEVSESGQWAAGGVALTGQTIDRATADTVFLDANDTASGTAADLANVHGVFVYDDTLTTPVADQGVCYNYLGGANSITNGTFTVVWHANGLWRATLT